MRNCEANYVAGFSFERLHFRYCGIHVLGFGCGHGLNSHGMAPAKFQIANFTGSSFASCDRHWDLSNMK